MLLESANTIVSLLNTPPSFLENKLALVTSGSLGTPGGDSSYNSHAGAPGPLHVVREK